jgi:hypothetical protein
MGFPNKSSLYQHIQSIITEQICTALGGSVTALGTGRVWGITLQAAGKANGQVIAILRDTAGAVDGSGTTIGTFKTGVSAAIGQGGVVQIPIPGLQYNRGLSIELQFVNANDGAAAVLFEKL